MKKLFSLVIALQFLSGCSLLFCTESSSKCKYEVDGLSCTNERVYQPLDFIGQEITNNYTLYTFTDYEYCKKVVKKSKEDESIFNTVYAMGCGNRKDYSNFYFYSDGTKDGDFYYTLDAPMAVRFRAPDMYHPYGYEEGFKPFFTSLSAVRKFQQGNRSNLTTLIGSSFSSVHRIKIKRFD